MTSSQFKPKIAIISAGIIGVWLADQWQAAFNLEIFESSFFYAVRFTHGDFLAGLFDRVAR